MKKLQIISINSYNYELREGNGNIYKVNLEFYDLDQTPKVGDYIFMAKELLDKSYQEYDTFYRFGKLKGAYGRELTSEQDFDIMGLKVGDKLVYLQRYYG